MSVSFAKSFEMVLLTTVLCLVVILCIITSVYIWIKYKYNYWNRRGINGPKPLPLLGNMDMDVLLLKINVISKIKEYYDQFPKEPVIGIFQGFRPVLVVRDLEIIKQIMVKEFNVFRNKGVRSNIDSTRESLFVADDEKWRTLRSLMNPGLTSSKLKQWSTTLQKCLDDYTKFIGSLVETQTDHEIKSIVSKYNLAVTGACLFSIDLDPFSGKCENVMNKMNEVIKITSKLFWRDLICRFCPAIGYFLQKFLTMNSKVLIITSQFIDRALEERKNNPHLVNDLVSLIMKIKDEKPVKSKKSTIEITDDVLLATASFYTLATYDASASLVTFLLHELAFNQTIQDRVHKEIKEITDKYEGNASTYEILDEMKYLQMVLNEAHRKYPVTSIIRESSQDYVFSGTDIKIEKNTRIIIPLNAIQTDPAHFENPEVFDPERFSPENKSKIPRFAFLPFGEGPRQCIGMRFGKLQAMAGLAAFLAKYKVEPSRKSERHPKFCPTSLTLQPLSGVWLKISRRT